MSEEDFKELFPERKPPRYKWCLRLRFLEWLDRGRVVVLTKKYVQTQRRYTLAFKRNNQIICYKDPFDERSGTLTLGPDGYVNDEEYEDWKFLNKKWEFIKNL